MLVARIAMAAALALARVGQPHAQEWEWGYWVIAGSIHVEAKDRESAVAVIADGIEPCGYVTFSDLSAKFALFEPGYTVAVIGPFKLEASAELARERIQRCIPDAYVKYGGYLGE
jgi:hypothetical protein